MTMVMTFMYFVVDLEKHNQGCLSNLCGVWEWRVVHGFNERLKDTNRLGWWTAINKTESHYSPASSVLVGSYCWPTNALMPQNGAEDPHIRTACFLTLSSTTPLPLFIGAICFPQILPLTFCLSSCFFIHPKCLVIHFFLKILFILLDPTQKVISLLK